MNHLLEWSDYIGCHCGSADYLVERTSALTVILIRNTTDRSTVFVSTLLLRALRIYIVVHDIDLVFWVCAYVLVTFTSKSFGMTRGIFLFLLYTKDIWVWDQRNDMRWKFIISGFIWCYVLLNTLNNTEDSPFCIRWCKFWVSKRTGTCDSGVSCEIDFHTITSSKWLLVLAFCLTCKECICC